MKNSKTFATFLFLIGATILISNTYTQHRRPNHSTTVTYTGEIHDSNKTFRFTYNLSVLGRAVLRNDTVLIKSNRSKPEILETCNHEIIHFLFPEYRHPEPLPEDRLDDPVYRLDEYTRLPICNRVVEKALNRQN